MHDMGTHPLQELIAKKAADSGGNQNDGAAGSGAVSERSLDCVTEWAEERRKKMETIGGDQQDKDMRQDVLGALAMDLEKFHAWGLPCMGFITMQRSRKKMTTAGTRIGAATGLKGKLWESAPIQSSKVVGLSEMVTDVRTESPQEQFKQGRSPSVAGDSAQSKGDALAFTFVLA
eukprot:g10344.t1